MLCTFINAKYPTRGKLAATSFALFFKELIHKEVKRRCALEDKVVNALLAGALI
jgi:hypothetical protein